MSQPNRPYILQDDDPEFPRKPDPLSRANRFNTVSFDPSDNQPHTLLIDEDNTNLFTEKREKLEFLLKDGVTFEKIMKINFEVKTIREDVARNPEANTIYEKLANKLLKINRKTFNWTIDGSNINPMTSIYQMVNSFGHWSHFMFVDYQPLVRDFLPIKFFTTFLDVPYYTFDENDNMYDNISSFYSELIGAFTKLYVRFPMGQFPMINPDEVVLVDPFMREAIRANNMEHYNREVEQKHGFNLVSQINLILDRFVLTGSLRWTNNRNQHILLPILILVSSAFAAGLVEYDEIPHLISSIYMTSEIISFLENEMKDHKIKVRGLGIKHKRHTLTKEQSHKPFEELQQCRIFIAKIVIHTITMLCDRDFVDSCKRHHNNLGISKESALPRFICHQEQVYKNICLIYLKYLSSRLSVGEVSGLDEGLEINKNMILLFLTNYHDDFFLHSLTFFNEDRKELYFETPTFDVQSNTALALKAIDNFVEVIKNLPVSGSKDQLNEPFEIFMKLVFESVSNDQLTATENLGARESRMAIKLNEANRKQLASQKLEYTRTGVIRFFINVLDMLKLDKSQKDLHIRGLKTLTELLRDNHAGQSLLFRGSTRQSYENLFRTSKFRCMNMILDIFKDDYKLFHLSDHVFKIKLDLYKSMIEEFTHLETRKDDSQKFRLSIGSLRFSNTFFENIVRLNLETKKNQKKYDIIIQLNIVDIICDLVIPAFCNPAFSAQFINQSPCPIDLLEISKFTFSLNNLHHHNEYFKSAHLGMILYELYFSFLKLFNRATTYAYPGIVYTKVMNALSRNTLENINYNFESGIVLRMHFTKLFRRFKFFPNNHILYESLTRNHLLNIERKFIPDNVKELADFILNEFDWLDQLNSKNQDALDRYPDKQNNEEYKRVVARNREMVSDYLMKGLLPTLYKFFKGVEGSITIMEGKNIISDLRNCSEKLVKKFVNREESMYEQLGLGRPDGVTKTSLETEEKKNRVPSIDKLGTSENLPFLGEDKPSSDNLLDQIKSFKPKKRAESKDNLKVKRRLNSSARRSNFVTDGSGNRLIDNERKQVKNDDILEERLNRDLGIVRLKIRTGISFLDQIYEKLPAYAYCINLFTTNMSSEHANSLKFNEYSFKNMKNDRHVKESKIRAKKLQVKANAVMKPRELREKEHHPGKHNIIQVMKGFYKQKRFDYNFKRNVFIHLLTVDQNAEMYNFNIAEGCILLLSNLDNGADHNTYERCFFINNNFTNYLVSMNNLLHQSPRLREKIHQILSETTIDLTFNKASSKNLKNEATDIAFMQSIWSILVNLTLFVYYKNFTDKYYLEFATKFDLVSSFFQNFFLNNFIKFKEFFNTMHCGILVNNGYWKEGEKASIFIENFVQMKVFFKKSQVAKNHESYIVPSDRPDMFPVLVQIVKNVTESVTGPCLMNQLEIYNRNTYIWNGIISRIIDDVDSKFYEVKLAVLLYIQGLLQGLNETIVEFMSEQLKIQTFYETIIILTKKLYVAQKKINVAEHSDDLIQNDLQILEATRERIFKNYNRQNHFETWDNSAEKFSVIDSPSPLIDAYKYDEQFNTHIIIKIIVTSYVMMRNLGDKIKFWELYLEEKEHQALKWSASKKDKEKNIIFNFVLKIMFNVEVVYQVEPEDLKLHKRHHHAFRDSRVDELTLQRVSKNNNMGGVLPQNHPVAVTSSPHHPVEKVHSHAHDAPDHKHIHTTEKKPEMRSILRRFYFQTPPSCFFFTEHIKEELLAEMPVENTVAKQLYLYKNLKHVQKQVESHRSNMTRFGRIANLVTGDAFVYYQWFLILAGIGLNIIMLNYLINPSQAPSQLKSYNERGTILIRVWAIVLCAVSFFVMCMWMVFRWKIEARIFKEEIVREKLRDLTRKEKWKVYLFDSLWLNSTFLTYFLLMIINLLGIVAYQGIFTFNVFLLIKMFKPLYYIMRSLLDNYEKLLVTFLLLLLMVYFYAFIVATSLFDRISLEVQGPQICRSLITCFMNTFNSGFRPSGGIGDIMEIIDEPLLQRFWLIWFFNISYVIMVKLILLNIVAGIIVETFGELRDENNERDNDERDYCVICGMDRWESEKRLLPFEHHKKVTHNMWNYFYFLIRLNTSNKADLVGMEYRVMDQITKGDTKWFPQKKFLNKDCGYMLLKHNQEEETEKGHEE